MPTRRGLWLAAVVAFALAAALSGWFARPPAPRYTVTDLGVLPGATLSRASGLNNRGDVVGFSGSERRNLQHGFLYRNGTLTDLGLFGLMTSHDGPVINDSGQITGVLEIPGVPPAFHVLLADAAGRHDLGVPPGYLMGLGDGINSRGQIVLNALGKPGPTEYVTHAFLDSGGRMTDIGGLPGSTDVLPAGINAAGQVIGDCERQAGDLQAFVYDSRTRKMTALATPAGMNSDASGINDQGQIIGAVYAPGGKAQAVLWAEDRMTRLGTLPGLEDTAGTAINNRGEAVGAASSKPGRLSKFVNDHPIRLKPLLPLFQQTMTEHAFVYRNGRMQDLNGLIPARSGWVLESASGINDRGQIVGKGLHHGQERAFLLTPTR